MGIHTDTRRKPLGDRITKRQIHDKSTSHLTLAQPINKAYVPLSHKKGNRSPSLLRVPPIFEPPLSNDGEGGGQYYCFSCGESTNPGASFVSIHRLWEVLREGATLRQIITAQVPLQVCIPCILIASHRKLVWSRRPGLMPIEMNSFYAYARLLARAIARTKQDTLVEPDLCQDLFAHMPQHLLAKGITETERREQRSDSFRIFSEEQCCGCCRDISFRRPYMHIGIVVDIPTNGGGCKASNVFCIAQYCNACAKRLFSMAR